ncbi:hypothetical protein SRABI27_03695 [Pedobacter sp. Bi27]|uniref:hypothetical protein n=1 Tax=Pedobacter sp. Bi27 TaxID=2822351 RepID=UPI001D9E693A|nr:hypothetical protein [Pedobacter sp. Bi27]CAH0278179.1 hypothetical protein SRABI27_03695 [Pedobacter sp. Bi27]
MSKNSNIYSQGGGGSSFETEVQTAFLFSFLLRLHLPGGAGVISGFRQQSSSLGYYTDDLYLESQVGDGVSRILCQVKHNLTISTNGEEFKQVIINAWKDFNNSEGFNESRDRIFIIKSDLILDEKNHLNVMLDWARRKSSFVDFFGEVNRIKAKKRYLDIFRSIVSGECIDLTDESLFNFLKVIYVLEMDFGSSTSLQKAAILSLIARYKTNTAHSASEIWAVGYELVSTGNYNGQQISDNMLPPELKGYFGVTSTAEQVSEIERLGRQNNEIIGNMEDTIGGYFYPRTGLFDAFSSTLEVGRGLLVYGNPGAGKSALVKHMLLNGPFNNSGLTLSFKADELGEGNLRDYFADKGIYLTLEEIFGYFALCDSNIIYIDAMEKLLEGTGTAFSQLLSASRKLPRTKFIISVRNSDLALLEMKYPDIVDFGRLEVPILEDFELESIAEHLPELKAAIANPKLRKLLRIPKYLDFALRAARSWPTIGENIDETVFRQILWDCIIENKLNGSTKGFPQKRREAFIGLAVSRARSMRPYVRSVADPEILEVLVKEQVIVEGRENGNFAPAHDILEDWALIRYVDGIFDIHGSSAGFFDELGTAPAIRRAYRLWVNFILKEEYRNRINLVTDTVIKNTGKGGGYWRDESIIGILQSDYCAAFFARHDADLKKDSFSLLWRIIHIMRMACRESRGEIDQRNYVPIGQGWASVITFLRQNIAMLPQEKSALIFTVVQEWAKLVAYDEILPAPTRDAGLIVIALLKSHYKPTYSNKNEVDLVVKVLCSLVGGVTEEIRALLEDPAEEDDDDDWDDDTIRGRLIGHALSGKYSEEISKYLPDIVIGLAEKKWLRLSCEVDYPDENSHMPLSRMLGGRRETEVEGHFGLIEHYRRSYFPPSSLQTPLRWLLRYHEEKAMTFIIRLLNWSAENYFLSDFSDDDDCGYIELILPDGSKVNQLASNPLWELFRGGQKVSPYLLQSVLMALEAYLLDLCSTGIENREKIDQIVQRLIRESITVSTTAVVASLYMAYPEFAGEYLATLYSHRRLMKLDTERYLGDMTKFELGSEDAELDRERHLSNRLTHRKRYNPGLRGFINEYCFSYGYANNKIFEMIDMHRAAADSSDFAWLRILDEIDNRTWRVTEKVDLGDSLRLQIAPTYKDEIAPYVDKIKKEAQARDIDSEYRWWLIQGKKHEISVAVEKWREVFQYYNGMPEYSPMLHNPGMLAHLGIRDLWEQLSQEERIWVEETIFRIFEAKIKRFFTPYDWETKISVHDTDAVMEAYLLLALKKDIQNHSEHTLNVIAFLTSPFQENDPDAGIFMASFSKFIWKDDPEFGKKAVRCILRYSQFSMKNSFFRVREKGQGAVDEYWMAYDAVVSKALEEEESSEITMEAFDIESDNFDILLRVIHILPRDTGEQWVFDLLKNLYDLIVAELFKEGKRSYRGRQEVHSLRYALSKKISETVFWNEGNNAQSFFTLILETGSLSMRTAFTEKRRDFYEVFNFHKDILVKIILLADNNLPADNEEEVEATARRFFVAWTTLRNFTLINNFPLFGKFLFLDISWQQTATDWPPLEGREKFFLDMMEVAGDLHMRSLINLAAFIGDQRMLVDILIWLIPRLISPEAAELLPALENLDRLVLRAYKNHLSEIMDDRVLQYDFLALLDVLVENGSSDAYWIREFMISFSNPL